MRRLTLRHLSGGFLGGALGILTFGLLGSWFMPIGCLFGVLIGFYPDVISREIKKGWLASISWLKNLETSQPTFRMPHFKESKLYLAYCAWRNPQDDHPMDRAYRIINYASAASFIPLIVTFIILGNSLGESIWLTVAQIFVLAISLIGFFFLMVGFYTNKEKPFRWSMAQYYRRYEIYSRYKGIGLFLYQIYTYYKIQVAILTAFISVILYWAVLTPVFICLLGIFWIVAYTFKAIYHVSKRTDHWICLAMVLIGTSMSAYFFRQHMAGQTLWLLSLGNGIFSALLSEGARRVMVLVFEKQVNLRTLVTSNIENNIELKWETFKSNQSFGFTLIENRMTPY